MIETEVHQRLRAYLREQGHTQWPHHLTMARLVARALRIGRSALIQTDSLAAYQGSYRLSYLIPALLWPEPAVLVLPEALIDVIVQQAIPNLQQNLPVIKPVQRGDRWPSADFRGLLVTSAEVWLSDRLSDPLQSSTLDSSGRATSNRSPFGSRFPDDIPTIIDGANDLEQWVRSQLSISLSNTDWEALNLAYPSQRVFIRDIRVRITHAIFQHPANPYSCHLIDEPEKVLLLELHDALQTHGASGGQMPQRWQTFWRCFIQPERLAWSQLNREIGSVMFCCGPTDIHQVLAPMWQRQPLVLIGSALDADKKAMRYRERMGLGDMTCLSFGPDRHHDLVQLYLPDRLPMPNTSHFKSAVLQEIRILLGARQQAIAQQHFQSASGPTVILIGDVPLKTQFASVLSAEFGSRVQLESLIEDNGILIAGWDYWQAHQSEFAPPALLIITTLPIPSLENPLVAGRVAAYKRRRQDWFKSYLLPEALSRLQKAVAPVRSHRDVTDTTTEEALSGVVALLDNRVNHRSYGRQILSALSPAARSSYLDPDWFTPSACPSVD
ncbi:MAG: helicase C-terminal domain-containing protein [Cyanobacteria bacterium P01_C01_bin.121]